VADAPATTNESEEKLDMIGHSQDPMDLFDNIGLQSWMFIEKVRTHARARARGCC
jgi:hypothetical protein